MRLADISTRMHSHGENIPSAEGMKALQSAIRDTFWKVFSRMGGKSITNGLWEGWKRSDDWFSALPESIVDRFLQFSADAVDNEMQEMIREMF